jgi:Raf kinase inhibitor-like YbhB/YbcL family protein
MNDRDHDEQGWHIGERRTKRDTIMPAMKRIALVSFLLFLGPFLGFNFGCKKSANDSQLGDIAVKIQLSSTAFGERANIPKQHTEDGKNVSPTLRWSDPPEETKSFALICDDPNAPRGTWVHWVIFNRPGSPHELEEGVPTQVELPNGARQGKNDFGKISYGVPAPPRGKLHRYFFNLYALNMLLELAPGSTKDQLIAAMKGHVLAEGQLMGQYGR